MNGSNLYLTIDLEVQTKLEEIVTRYLKESGKEKAAALVLDPSSGEV